MDIKDEAHHMSAETTDQPTLTLHCFAGAAPPQEIIEGIKYMGKLPERGIQQIWPLIEASLQTPDASGNNDLLRWFCEQQTLDPTLVMTAVRCLDLMLRQAAALDLSSEAFREDIEILWADDSAVVQLLLPRYAAVHAWLRQRIVEDTLADHGKVLVALDWRLDQVHASHRGTSINTPVAFLRLNYREGEEPRQISLQLTPDTVRTLRNVCNELLDD